MKYKEHPFPTLEVATALSMSVPCGIAFLLILSVDMDIINRMSLLGGMGLFWLAIIIFAIASVIKHNIIRNYMRDEKFVKCTDFEIVERIIRNRRTYGFRTVYYARGTITLANGKSRVVKSSCFPKTLLPFSDMEELIVFTDIEKSLSPYYIYPCKIQ